MEPAAQPPKKRGRPKGSMNKPKAPRQVPAKAKANWGPGENPRRCKMCQSTRTSVIQVYPRMDDPERVYRKRHCENCGHVFRTEDDIS